MKSTEVMLDQSVSEASLNLPSMEPHAASCPLEVYPPAVHFEAVQPGYAYIMSISVRNKGHESRRIRLSIPHARSPFTVSYTPLPSLALGMEQRAEIGFCLENENNGELETTKNSNSSNDKGPSATFTDELIVMAGKDRIEIPLSASLPSPIIAFDSFVKLGPIALEQRGSKEVKFCNNGSKAGLFSIAYNKDLPVRIHPTSKSLDPGQSVIVQVDVDAKALGPFRAIAEVHIDQQPSKLLDINAQIVQQKLELVSGEGQQPLTTIDFGSLFFGQAKTIQGLVINDGPQPVNYSTVIAIDDNLHERFGLPSGFQGPGEAEHQEGEKKEAHEAEELRHINVSPSGSLIDPLAQTAISFTFQPQAPQFIKGFNALRPSISRQLAYNLTIEAPESGNQKVTSQLTGRAITPELLVSHETLDFGHCPMHEQRGINVTLENPTELAMPFRFSSCSLIHCLPKSGIIAPGQSQNAVVSYKPNQMGILRRKLIIHAAKGLVQVPLQLLGSSTTIGIKPPLVGGPDKSPEDFAARFTFVKEGKGDGDAANAQEDELAMTGGGRPRSQGPFTVARKTKTKPWEEVDLIASTTWDETINSSEGGLPIGAMPQYTYSIQRLAKNDEHKQKYNNLLKTTHEKKKRLEKSTIKAQRVAKLQRDPDDPQNPIDLGLSRGMTAPIPCIPKPTDKLWTATGGNDEGQQGLHKKLNIDENRLMTKKFKAKPSTQAEVRDCSKGLTPHELLNIVSSTKVLDFGRVSVDSTARKSFVIANFLHHPILVSLAGGSATVHSAANEEVTADAGVDKIDIELRGSGPASQVVPEGLMAGFDICFTSATIGPVKRTMSYIINNQFIFKFIIKADVAPLELFVSTSDLTMRFPETSLEATVSETIQIENPGTSSCEFSWTCHGPFTVQPLQGAVPARGKVDAVVTWRPLPGVKNEDVLGLSVHGGVDTHIKVRGISSETKVVIREKKVDYGVCAVGIKQEKVIHIKNQHPSNAAVIALESSANSMATSILSAASLTSSLQQQQHATVPGLSACPDVFRLEAGDVIEITIGLAPPIPRNYQGTSAVFTVRGGKSLKIPLLGESVVPDVRLEQASFDFGKVAIGSDVMIPLLLTNRGNIAASLTLDLTAYPGFTVYSLPADIEVTSIMDNGAADKIDRDSVIIPSSMDSIGDTGAAAISGRGGITSGFGTRITFPTSPNTLARTATKWHILLPPGIELKTSLVFAPEFLGQSFFLLPLGLQGLTSVGIEADRFRVPINGQGVETRILLTSTIDFGDRVVTTGPGSSNTYHMEMEISNPSRNGLSWEIDEAPLKNYKSKSGPNLFFVSPKSGDLAPHGNDKIRVTFNPRGPNDYRVNVPLYLADQADRTHPYMTLRLRGSGIKPGLEFSTSHLMMPIVPLGVTSCARFEVINQGFVAIELKPKLPSYSPVEFSITFPEGDQLGTGIQRVPVEITFTATKPASFHLPLTFTDSEENTFTISVLGLADNCLLSNWRFLDLYADKYTLYKKPCESGSGAVTLYPNSSVQAMKEQESKELEAQREQEQAARLARVKMLMSEEGEGGGEGDESLASSIDGPGKVAKVQQGSEKARNALAKAFEPPNGERMQTEVGKEDPALSSASLSLLLAWLSHNVMPHRHITSFPSDLYDNNGLMAFEALEAMAGKAMPGKAKIIAASRRERVGQLVGQYASMLHFLKEKGALLNPVAPEHLLNKEDFIFYKESLEAGKTGAKGSGSQRITPAKARELHTLWEKAWPVLSAESWTLVLYQAIRTFLLLTRVTSKSFVTLPGMSEIRIDSKEEAALASSRAYTVSEGVLLKWLNCHVAKHSGADVSAIFDFSKDLKDGSVLAHVILSHVPSLQAVKGPLEGFCPITKTQELLLAEVREENINKVLQAMDHLHINFGITPQSILHGSRADLLLLVMHLYQTLPQFVPRSTIEFKSVLGSPNRKVIGLYNPHSFHIKYHVTMEGSEDFRIAAEEVEMGPNSYCEFPVECEPRFSNDVEGRLTFWVQRHGGGIHGATSNMVFLLQSHVTDRRASMTYNIKAKCYENQTVPLEIKNPLPGDANFSISMTQRFVEPILFKSRASGGKGAGSSKSHKGGFAITSSEKSSVISKKGLSGNKKGASTKQPTPDKLQPKNDEEKEVISLATEPLFIPHESLKIRRGEGGTLSMQILGFYPGIYRAQIMLKDTALGEFIIDVVATVELPKPMQRLDCALNAQEKDLRRDIKFCSSNTAYQKAITSTLERLPPASRPRARQLLSSLFKIASNDEVPPTSSSSSIIPPEASSTVPYTVEIDSPFWSMPPVVQMRVDNIPAMPPGPTGGGDAAGSGRPSMSGPFPAPLAISERRPSVIAALQNTDPMVQAPITGQHSYQRRTSLTVISTPGLKDRLLTTPLASAPLVREGDAAAATVNDNSSTITMNAKEAGSYSCCLFMYPKSSGVPDFRVYYIEAELLAESAPSSFTFKVASRQTLTQEIPVVNTKDQSLDFVVSVEGSRCFSGPSSFTTPAKSMGNKVTKYKLTFSPTLVGEEKARLLFRCLVSPADSFEYELTGVGEEPLAEGTIKLRRKARETLEETIKVTNPFKQEMTFKVQSDLPFVGGEPEITVPANAEGSYTVIVTPQVGGKYHGFLRFTASNEQSIWFAVELIADAPVAEKTIEAIAKVREAVLIELVIENPFKRTLDLEVIIDGEYLIGNASVSLEPQETRSYQLVYSPLIPKAHEGAITFLNAEVGEFWYKVKLLALPSEPIHLNRVTCAVGGKVSIPVTIENPVGMSATFTLQNSNPKNFRIEPRQISMAPFASTDFEIIYTPSTLSSTELATIILHHPQIGTWQYDIEGMGELPGVMTEHFPTSVVGQMSSYMMSFRNPFDSPLSVDIVLAIDKPASSRKAGFRDDDVGDDECTLSDSDVSDTEGSGSEADFNNGKQENEKDAEGSNVMPDLLSVGPSVDGPVFSLLLKKKVGIILPTFASMQVPLSFFPRSIEARTATVEIRGDYRGHELTWVYPIKGIAEAPIQRRACSLKCKAKKSLRQAIELDLQGLESVDAGGEDFTYELSVPMVIATGKREGEGNGKGGSKTSPQHNDISKWLVVTPIKTDIQYVGESLCYMLAWEPEKPMPATMVELIVSRNSGGRWRYEMRLEATEPDPDDHIFIEAAVNSTTIVNFRLANRQLPYAPFQAYFSTDSAYSITVTPTTGILPPYGSEGQLFPLSFSPTEYGKYERGRLYIETEESLWSYEVKGVYPGFEPPRNVQAKVETHISKKLGESLRLSQSINKTGNIIRRNMSSIRSSHESSEKLRGTKVISKSGGSSHRSHLDHQEGSKRAPKSPTLTFDPTITFSEDSIASTTHRG